MRLKETFLPRCRGSGKFFNFLRRTVVENFPASDILPLGQCNELKQGPVSGASYPLKAKLLTAASKPVSLLGVFPFVECFFYLVSFNMVDIEAFSSEVWCFRIFERFLEEQKRKEHPQLYRMSSCHSAWQLQPWDCQPSLNASTYLFPLYRQA